MIKVWFSDIDILNASGQTIKLENNFFYVNSCILRNYLPPIITEDSWNGQTFPVQIDIWDGYQMKVAQRDLSINFLALVQSCKTVIIQDCDTNEIINIDTSASGAITIEPQGRLGTVNQSFLITFKSNRQLSYPGIVRNNTYNLKCTYNSVEYTFYTDKDIINFVNDTETEQFDNESGIKYTSKTISKEGKRMLFYYPETEALFLKKICELTEPANILINEVTTVLENMKCTLTALTEGLYKCEVEAITSSLVNYPDLS